MRLTIDRQELLHGLGRIQAIVERRGTLPILANVLIEAQAGVLTLSATDLEVGMISKHEAKIEEEGAATLGAKKLHELVREFDEAELLFSTDENARVRIECGSARVSLLSISPDEYPSLPTAEGATFVEFESSLLGEMIDYTLYATSTDETRYNLNGIYAEVVGDSLVFVATDGHRLSKVAKKPPTPITFLDKGIIVPRKGMTEIRRLCDETDGAVEIGLQEGFMLVRCAQLLLSCRLIDGEFVDYHRVIPSTQQIRLVLQREHLMHAVRRISVVAHERSGGFQLALDDGVLELTASNPDLGEAREEIQLEYRGDSFKTGFRARYVLDTLGSMSCKEVVLELLDELSPAVIRPVDDPDLLAVIMPMRV